MASDDHPTPITTGIFYHPSFSRRSYLTQGSRLQDFPDALDVLLKSPHYRLYEPPCVDDEIILKVHSEELLLEVKRDNLCSTAWHSVGAVLMAAEKIVQGEINNAFAFIGAGGHHSGRNFFGGYCCFNDVVIAIHMLRERYGISRIAILDTDAHHADGTRDLVKHDPNVLHVCVCSTSYESPDGKKVDIPAPNASWYSFASTRSVETDEIYARSTMEVFEPRVRSFVPEIIFWYFGFDTHQGDYGDLGLSVDAYERITRNVKRLAGELCQGRLEVVLGGGSRSDIAKKTIPPIIGILGDAKI